MAQVYESFSLLDKNPTPWYLETFATHIETLSQMLSFDEMKTALIACISRVLREQKFDKIRENEIMLRLYKVMSKYSNTLGARGIYEQLFKRKLFFKSLKFYLQWAEECAKDKMRDKFKEVLQLARSALSETLEMSSIESGFRDLVDEYFDGISEDLFMKPDDTMNLFRFNRGTKVKRRSSVCLLQHNAPINSSGACVFGPCTKTNLRQEFIDTSTHNGVSIEEFHYAKWKDTFGEDVDSDNRKRKDSGVVFIQYQTSETDQKSRVDVENRMNANLNPRRRHLSPVSEKTADEDEEKRSRFNSPLISTKNAPKVPLRNLSVNEKLSTTITLSSDTKSMKDVTYNDSDDSVHLKMMSAGKKELNGTEKASNVSSNYSTTSAKNAKSGAGLDLMAENNCLEAHAMFSDTVHLGSEKTLLIKDDSVIVSGQTRSLAPSQMTSDFSVLCDPDPTITLVPERSRKASAGLNMVYDEGTVKEDPPINSATHTEYCNIGEKNVVSPDLKVTPVSNDDAYDDEMLCGFGRPSRGAIVTSTPAQGIPFVDIEAYFGNKDDDNHCDQKPAFLVPSSSTFNKMIRRKSQAPAPVASAPLPSESRPVDLKESSIDCLTTNLGKRLSLVPDEFQNATEDDAEITGCKNRRRSEVIKKGDINPWDETLRKKLMNLVRPALNMHEFQERAPKIQALRDCEVGGELFHIQNLIGQGGYAKVYRAVNEEKKTVAIKYEVPSCSWEVYICDQMRNRLLKDGGEDRAKIADFCIMQVMDAYVFSTASLLVNEYHEYGTLLEYANNMKDPNWHVTCLLITQMSRILKEVHSCKIIHGDIKPDNFMITRKIDAAWGKESLMSSDSFVLKIIDWGRAIDMMPLGDQRFKGRAGTEGFDSPEMIDGRSWTYQADFFGFAATVAVIATGKYAELKCDAVGSYYLNLDIKRRNVLRSTINEMLQSFLNIPSCEALPDWSDTIRTLSEFWENNFDASAWRQAVGKFNEACDLVANNK